mgnify:CR=1 FL=1
MDEQQTATRELVERMLRATGLTPSELAERAGLAASTLTRFLNKPVKHTLSARTLAKLSAASGVPVPAVVVGAHVGRGAPLPSPGGTGPVSADPMVRRLRAARIAYGDIDVAASAIGVSPETLREYESGERPIPNDFLLRFSEVTGCPLDWIFLGKITAAMSAEMAVRIALADPEMAALAASGPVMSAEASRKPARRRKE